MNRMRARTLLLTVLVAVLAAGTGCGASRFHAEEAAREQRAADDLRRGGATEAGRAAQNRADAHQRDASCWDFLECVVDAIFSIRKEK